MKFSCSSFFALAVACAGMSLSGLLADVAMYRDKVKSTDGLVDYYDLDGNYEDSFDGGNLFNDGSGGPEPSFRLGINDEGQAAVFDGIAKYLRIARPVQDDFTIISWINASVSGIGTELSQNYEGSGLIHADWPQIPGYDFGMALTGNVAAFGVGNGDFGGDDTIHSTTWIADSQWYQIVAVRRVIPDTSNSEIQIYVNGVLEASNFEPNMQPLSSQPSVTIGGNVIDNRYFAGAMDEIAFIGTALTDIDIQTLYGTLGNEGLEKYREAVKAVEGLIDYYDFEGNFDDSIDGGNGFNNPDNLVPLPNRPTFEVGLHDEFQGALFDGIDDFFPIQRSIQDDFTILAWMRTDVNGIGIETSQYYQGSGFIYADVPGLAYDFGTAITGTVFGFGLGNQIGGGDATIHSTTPVITGEWIQVAAVRQVDFAMGTNEMRLYINGVLEDSATYSVSAPMNAANQITIGGNVVDSRYYSGMIDEIALFGVALDDQTIQDIYNALLGLSPCFTPDRTEGTAPLDVHFDATCSQSAGSPIGSYNWDFGDGEIAEGIQVLHTYQKAGLYKAVLFVTTGAGDSASTSQMIDVHFPSGDVSPWVSEDIGDSPPAVQGGARRDGECLEVFAGGKDPSLSSDQFHFVHLPLVGDGSIIARISEADWPSDARLGVMVREDLTPGSRYVSMMLYNTTASKYAFVRREVADTAAKTPKLSTDTFKIPNSWVRIERQGNVFIGSYSQDKQTWKELGRVTLDFPETVRAGIAATARDMKDEYRTMTAKICEAAVTGMSAPPAAPTGLSATAGTGQISLDWNDNSEGDLLGYNAYRSGTQGGPYSKLNTSPIGGSAYVDNDVVPGTPYYYVVRAVGPGGESADSNEVNATPLAGGGFKRGDANGDGGVDLSDPVNVLGFLFLGNPTTLVCPDAADADDTGELDITDAVYSLNWQFLGGKDLPAPGPFTCGGDLAADSLPACDYPQDKCQ